MTREHEPHFAGAFDAALGGAVTSGGELALKAGAAFLDSAIGKILITLVAGVITGGAGAAIVGPILAAIGPTLPAMLIGETTFLSDWVADMTAYTNSPLVLQVPGLSDAIGTDTARAMLYIQQQKIGPKQAEIDRRVQQHDMQGGFLDTPEAFAAWYRTMMIEVIGPDAKYVGSPDELATKLGIRPDAAAMAIAVWNGTKLPDMSKYDPMTGWPKTVFFNQGPSASTSRNVIQAVTMQSAKTGITSGVKTGIIAAEAAPPTTMAAKAAPTLAAQAAIRQTAGAQAAQGAPPAAPSAGGFEPRDAAPVVAGVAAGAVASVAAGLTLGPVVAIGAGVALLTRWAMKR